MSTSNSTGGNSRMVLLLIAGIPLTMILAASWLWYFVVQGNLDLVSAIGTANRGTLIEPPRPLADVRFSDDAGAGYAWVDSEPRWTMLVINQGGYCDRACERRLYTTRQIHISLGKEFNRVRRAYISDQPIVANTVAVPDAPLAGWPEQLTANDFPALVAQMHNGLLPLSVTPDALINLFPEALAAPNQWYLVDPAGWVMMRFSDELSYKDVLSDLKFLLKNSGG
ncbi:MAG: hypothetical protein NWS22_08670 [Porticoccaceae bacterium]|nr:hypothetical protein [Porticoccaceae bacterium]